MVWQRPAGYHLRDADLERESLGHSVWGCMTGQCSKTDPHRSGVCIVYESDHGVCHTSITAGLLI
jgi:hypothetical protein